MRDFSNVSRNRVVSPVPFIIGYRVPQVCIYIYVYVFIYVCIYIYIYIYDAHIHIPLQICACILLLVPDPQEYAKKQRPEDRVWGVKV